MWIIYKIKNTITTSPSLCVLSIQKMWIIIKLANSIYWITQKKQQKKINKFRSNIYDSFLFKTSQRFVLFGL